MCRKRLLYTGLEVPVSLHALYEVVHIPLIDIIPQSPENDDIKGFFQSLPRASDLIFTSKTAVKIFFHLLPLFNFSVEDLKNKKALAVGKSTAAQLHFFNFTEVETALDETAEGVVDWLQKHPRKNRFFFWPHAEKSRPVIRDYFQQNNLPFKECVLYNTASRLIDSKLSLDIIDKIYFSSPSTVDVFYQHFGFFPKNIQYLCQGVVTKARLKTLTSSV